MTLADLQNQIAIMARPGRSTSTVIQQNSQTWINEFVLRELYKLRRWWFLQQQQHLPLVANQATYAVPGGGEALYIVSATSAGMDLLLPPLAQAQAFYAATGSPEAVALLVPGLPSGPPIAAVSQLQVFPTPDAIGPYAIDLTVTAPFAPLALGTDHNFITDQFPFLVIAGGLACAFLSLQEDSLFMQWWQLYANQVRALASYDHEVRRGGTMPEPIEPFVPSFILGAAGVPAAAAAG
jgi:hypothetical protein